MILHIEYDNCGATGCRIVKHVQLSTNGHNDFKLFNNCTLYIHGVTLPILGQEEWFREK